MEPIDKKENDLTPVRPGTTEHPETPVAESEADQIIRTDFVKVEKSLASLGFFTPSSKRVRSEKSKTIAVIRIVDGKRVEAKATIAPSAMYGLPITADQDKYLALQKIITDIQRRQGSVVNPVAFTSAELLKLLKRNDAGENYKEIAEWLKVMTLTGITSEGMVYFAGKKRWVSDTFHVFDRTVAMGKELPEGGVADRNYVWLSEWQLENINHNYLLPIDWEAYRQLRTHIAKALVPLLQIWLYASRDDGMFSKRYDELCQVLNVRQYRHRSKIREKLGPALDELQTHGYLASWRLEETSDGQGFKVIFQHGDKFHRDRRHRLGEATSSESSLDPAPVEPVSSPEEGSVNPNWLEALTKRGVAERRARQVLARIPREQPVQDQLEWADDVIAKSGDRIANPAGFCLSVVRDGVLPPDSFETSAKGRLNEEAAKAERELRAEKTRLRQAYEEYVQGETDHETGRLKPADYKTRLALKVEALTTEHATFAVWGPDQKRRIAQTALAKEIRSEIGYRLFDFTTFCRVQKLVDGPLGPPHQTQK